MNKVLVFLVVAALSGIFVACGSKTMSPDAKKFIKEYEAYVDDFCKSVDKLNKASLMQKMTLSHKIMRKGQGLKKYTDRQDHLKAGLTSAGEKKIDEIGAKADKCANNVKI